MKKRTTYALVAFVISSAFAATPTELLYPTVEVLRTECEAAYKEPNRSFSPYLGLLDGSSVIFQSPVGGVVSICQERAKQLRPAPDGALLSTNAILAVGGTVTDLSSARRWAAALAVRTPTGQELARVFPSESESEIGSTSSWNVNCSGGCRWTGRNYYIFKLDDTKFKEAVQQGNLVYALTSRDGNIKEYLLPDTFR